MLALPPCPGRRDRPVPGHFGSGINRFGDADYEHTPAFLSVGIDMVDLEGDDGVAESGPEFGAFTGTKDDPTVNHRVVDRQNGRKGVHRQADPSDRLLLQQGAALFFAQDLQAVVDGHTTSMAVVDSHEPEPKGTSCSRSHLEGYSLIGAAAAARSPALIRSESNGSSGRAPRYRRESVES